MDEFSLTIAEGKAHQNCAGRYYQRAL